MAVARRRRNPLLEHFYLILPHYIYLSVGAVAFVAALVMAFWAFSKDVLTTHHYFILSWMFPLAGAVSAGAFTGALRIRITNRLHNLAAIGSGAFAVWLITSLLLPNVLPGVYLTPEDQTELNKQLEKKFGPGTQIEFVPDERGRVKKVIILNIRPENRTEVIEFVRRQTADMAGHARLSPLVIETRPPDPLKRTREELLSLAWNAHDEKNWDQVVELTTNLLKVDEDPANKEQQELTEKKVPLTKTGRVGVDLGDADVQSNHSFGLINDVATALFLRGEANRQLKKEVEARADWKKVMTFDHAVTFSSVLKEFWRTKDEAENKIFQLDRKK